MDEESKSQETTEDPNTKKPPKKKKKKSVKKRRSRGGKEETKETVQLPPCQHQWCLGEVLKNAGIEPGVCWPRPLPWALTGKLRYLPGWQEQCRDFKLQKICYNVRPKKRNVDKEKFDYEVEQAKQLWSFIGPGLLYPKNPTYDDPEPGVVCDCIVSICKRKIQNPPEQQ